MILHIGADDRSDNVITDFEVGTAISEPDTEDASASTPETLGKKDFNTYDIHAHINL